MYPVTLSIGDVLKGSNKRTVPCDYASPASNGLLEKFIHFIEKAINVKGAFNVKLERQTLVYAGFLYAVHGL